MNLWDSARDDSPRAAECGQSRYFDGRGFQPIRKKRTQRRGAVTRDPPSTLFFHCAVGDLARFIYSCSTRERLDTRLGAHNIPGSKYVSSYNGERLITLMLSRSTKTQAHEALPRPTPWSLLVENTVITLACLQIFTPPAVASCARMISWHPVSLRKSSIAFHPYTTESSPRWPLVKPLWCFFSGGAPEGFCLGVFKKF